jgi:hypothetical protein
MRAVLALAGKDLRLLFRDKGDVFFTFVFPVILAIFFGFVFGGGGGSSRIELALVVESESRIAAGIAADLAADAAFEVQRMGTREAAVDAVRAGRLAAAIVLPATMQDGVDGLFAGRGIPIEAIVDPSHRAEAGLIQGKLNELAFRQFPRLLADRAQMSRLFAGARRSFAEADGMTASQKLLAAGMVAAGESFMNSVNPADPAVPANPAATGVAPEGAAPSADNGPTGTFSNS